MHHAATLETKQLGMRGMGSDEAFRQFLSRFFGADTTGFFYCRVYPEYVFTRKNETQRAYMYAQNTFALAAADERLELSRLIACIIVCHFLPRGASHDRDLHPLCISFEPFLFTKIWTKDDERRERMNLMR